MQSEVLLKHDRLANPFRDIASISGSFRITLFSLRTLLSPHLHTLESCWHGFKCFDVRPSRAALDILGARREPSPGRRSHWKETPRVSPDHHVTEDQRTPSSLGQQLWQSSSGGRWKVRPIRYASDLRSWKGRSFLAEQPVLPLMLPVR